MNKVLINHPQLGQYHQDISNSDDPKKAGHVELASKGKYGWEMPQDLPTFRLLKSNRIKGKVVLDLGCGWGRRIVIPAMRARASKVYALDVSAEHLDEKSLMKVSARRLHYSNLQTILLSEGWWDSTNKSPDIRSLIKPIEYDELPKEETIDVMTSRHVLQFGTPSTLATVLDLVSLLLKPDGVFAAINFTPYTGYMYNYDNGQTLRKIVSGNRQYALGNAEMPTGYLSHTNPFGVSLAMLLKKPEIAGKGFLYFDDDTVKGFLNNWAESRIFRGLPVNLVIEDAYYFTPSKIARFNKMVVSEFMEAENYYFTLRKSV